MERPGNPSIAREESTGSQVPASGRDRESVAPKGMSEDWF